MSNGIEELSPDSVSRQGSNAALVHRRPGYPLSVSVPAKPDSVSPGRFSVSIMATFVQVSLDTGDLPGKSTRT